MHLLLDSVMMYTIKVGWIVSGFRVHFFRLQQLYNTTPAVYLHNNNIPNIMILLLKMFLVILNNTMRNTA